MKRIIPILIGMYVLGFFSYRITRATFIDTGTMGSNTFVVAAVFPTLSAIPSVSPTSEPSSTPTLAPTMTITPTPGGISGHIVISEVQISGANTNQDFIELYNPTANPINLNGYSLVKKTASGGADTAIASWTTSTLVAGYSFYLLVSSVDTVFSASLDPDLTFTTALAPDNSIALKQGVTVVDGLGWGSLSGTHYTEGTALSDPTANHSLERKALSTSTVASMLAADASKGNGYDTNNNANDFTVRAVSQPQNSSSVAEMP